MELILKIDSKELSNRLREAEKSSNDSGDDRQRRSDQLSLLRFQSMIKKYRQQKRNFVITIRSDYTIDVQPLLQISQDPTTSHTDEDVSVQENEDFDYLGCGIAFAVVTLLAASREDFSATKCKKDIIKFARKYFEQLQRKSTRDELDLSTVVTFQRTSRWLQVGQTCSGSIKEDADEFQQALTEICLQFGNAFLLVKTQVFTLLSKPLAIVLFEWRSVESDDPHFIIRYFRNSEQVFKFIAKNISQKDFNLIPVAFSDTQKDQIHKLQRQWRTRRHYEENRESILEYKHVYRKEHREDIRESKSEYHESHGSRIREKKKRNRETHGEEIRKKEREQYQMNRFQKLKAKAKKLRLDKILMPGHAFGKRLPKKVLKQRERYQQDEQFRKRERERFKLYRLSQRSSRDSECASDVSCEEMNSDDDDRVFDAMIREYDAMNPQNETMDVDLPQQPVNQQYERTVKKL